MDSLYLVLFSNWLWIWGKTKSLSLSLSLLFPEDQRITTDTGVFKRNPIQHEVDYCRRLNGKWVLHISIELKVTKKKKMKTIT